MSNLLFDLSPHAKIELAGRDAREFLHNLCTQDIKSLPVGRGAEAFLTNSKARVLAHIFVMRREADVLWLDAAGPADRIVQHLDHYRISEQVDIVDRAADMAFFRILGERAGAILAGLIPDANALKPWDHVVADNCVVRRHALFVIDGLDLFCPRGEAEALRARLIGAGIVPGDAAGYHTLRIEAGLPEYGIDIDENRLAMEVNRTAQAICYTKGCYLGQETIVMARDRGQVNRLLMGLRLAVGDPPAPGTRVMRGNEEVGQVTSAAFSPRLGHAIALAYLRRGSWEPGTELTLDTPGGRAAIVSALPFVP